MTEPTKPPEPLTDADLSRLVTLVVIHEGESSTMRDESAERLGEHCMLSSSDPDEYPVIHYASPQGRALVERMLAAGRADA